MNTRILKVIHELLKVQSKVNAMQCARADGMNKYDNSMIDWHKYSDALDALALSGWIIQTGNNSDGMAEYSMNK